MKRKYKPSTIRTLDRFSAKEKMNIKFSLVLEKEKALQSEFVYSINNFEMFLATIEKDLCMMNFIEEEYKFQEYKARSKGYYYFKYTWPKLNETLKIDYNPLVLDFIKEKTGIYMFVNKVNKKIYIGKATNLYTRLKDYHDKHYHTMTISNSKILKALAKYKYKNFAFSIIEYCTVEDLQYKEQYYIDLLQPQYNIRRKTHVKYFNNTIDI